MYRPETWIYCASFSLQVKFRSDLRDRVKTVLVGNFGCESWDQYRIIPEIVFKLLCAAIWSCCAVWLEFEQTPFPWTCCWNMLICFNSIFFKSEANEWSKDCAKRWARFMSVNVLADSTEKWLVTQVTAQNLHTFLTLELSLYCKGGSTFSSREPAATATDLDMCCVCARPSNQPKPCRSAAPRAWSLVLQSKPSIVFWNSLWEWLPDDLQGLKLGLELELCRLTNES